MKAQWLVGSALVGSVLTIVACGGRTTGVDSGPSDGGTGTHVGSGSGSGTAIGSGSGTTIGSGSGTTIGSGSGSGTSIGSGSGTTIGSGSGSGTYIGSGSGSGTTIGSGSGSGCVGTVPMCEACGNFVSAECTPNGWECPPPPPCVAPFDAGFPDAIAPPPPPFSDAGSPELQCGAMSCDAANTYCVIEDGEPPPNGTSYECVIYPPECGATPTCACLSQNASGCACTQDPSTGGLTLKCDVN